MDYQTLKSKITSGGLKFTHQRMVIYEVLCKSEDHPTAEMVFSQVKEANPGLSKGTVYKTLESFVHANMVQKFTDNLGLMRFDPVLESHSHLYCSKTKKISDFKNADLEKMLKKYFEENQIDGFEVEEVSLVIKGKTK